MVWTPRDTVGGKQKHLSSENNIRPSEGKRVQPDYGFAFPPSELIWPDILISEPLVGESKVLASREEVVVAFDDGQNHVVPCGATLVMAEQNGKSRLPRLCKVGRVPVVFDESRHGQEREIESDDAVAAAANAYGNGRPNVRVAVKGFGTLRRHNRVRVPKVSRGRGEKT